MPTDPHVFFEEMILNERLGPDDYRRLVELLWDSYSRRIFLFAAAKLQNEEDARDVCLDAFVKAMSWIQKNPGQIPAKVNFPAWLTRIASNLIIERFREIALRRELSQDSSEYGDDGTRRTDWPDAQASEPFDQLTREEELAALRKCLEGLQERKRQCIIRADLEGAPHARVARELSMPLSTLNVTLHRTRKELRECVELQFAERGE